MLTEAIGPVRFANFTHNAATAKAIAAAVAGQSIRILGLVASNNHASNAVVITIQDNTGTPVVLIGPIQLAAGLPHLVLPTNGIGWGQAPVGKSVDILLDGTEVVAGAIAYQYIGRKT